MSESQTTQSIIESIPSKIKKFFKKAGIFSLVGLIIFIALYFAYTNYTYSEGTRTGYLIKTSKKGYIFKTFEGQLNLGGFGTDKSTGMIGNVWNFSIDDEEMYKKIQAFEGEKVTVSYTEINNAMPWQGETNYFVYDIKIKE
ncbi:MAG: 6-phosphogluconate dehydrogenase [Crocinitomicaceae bacterium]